MKKLISLSLCIPLTGCLSATQTAAVQTAIAPYETAVRNACSDFEAAANSPLGSLAELIPGVATAITLGKSGCDTEAAIQTLIASPTSEAWVNTLTVAVKTKGAVILPAPTAKVGS